MMEGRGRTQPVTFESGEFLVPASRAAYGICSKENVFVQQQSSNSNACNSFAADSAAVDKKGSEAKKVTASARASTQGSGSLPSILIPCISRSKQPSSAFNADGGGSSGGPRRSGSGGGDVEKRGRQLEESTMMNEGGGGSSNIKVAGDNAHFDSICINSSTEQDAYIDRIQDLRKTKPNFNFAAQNRATSAKGGSYVCKVQRIAAATASKLMSGAKNHMVTMYKTLQGRKMLTAPSTSRGSPFAVTKSFKELSIGELS